MFLISQALAEETANTATAAASATPVFSYLFMIIGAYEVFSGLMTILKKKLYGSNSGNFAQYTEESVVKATPYLGFSNLLCGLFLIVMGLKDARVLPISNTAEWITVGVVFVIAVALVIYTYKKVLIKKDPAN